MTSLIIHGLTTFIIASATAIGTAAATGEITSNAWYIAIAGGLVVAGKDIQSRLAKPPK